MQTKKQHQVVANFAESMHHVADLIELNLKRGDVSRATEHLTSGLSELRAWLKKERIGSVC